MDRPRASQGLLGARHRADAHDLGRDAGEREADHAHLLLQAELVGHGLRGQQGGGGAVVEAGAVAGGDAAVRAERRLQAGQALERGAGPRGLVGGEQAPALLGGAHGDRHEVGLDPALRVGMGGLLLGAEGERVGPLLGQVREAVVQVLGGRAHAERVEVDDAIGEEARVRVHALAHRVARHVLDAAGEGDVVGAGHDRRAQGRDRGHRARAHAVDGVAGHRVREAGEQRGRPADGHALVAHLRGRGDGDVVDARGRQVGVAAEQLTEDLDDEVVGPGLGEGVAGPPERGADPVDEHDFLRGTAHDGSQGLETKAPGRAAPAILPTSNYAGYSPVTTRSGRSSGVASRAAHRAPAVASTCHCRAPASRRRGAHGVGVRRLRRRPAQPAHGVGGDQVLDGQAEVLGDVGQGAARGGQPGEGGRVAVGPRPRRGRPGRRGPRPRGGLVDRELLGLGDRRPPPVQVALRTAAVELLAAGRGRPST